MTTEKWIEDYENEKASFLIYDKAIGSYWLNEPKLKSFISTLLEEQRKEIMMCLPEHKNQNFEGLARMDYWDDKEESSEDTGFNTCRSQFLTALKAKHLIK